MSERTAVIPGRISSREELIGAGHKGDSEKMSTDPVCGMQVSEQQARGESDYKGKTFYFCSTSCKDQFDLNPERYAGKQA
jgi:Cu+-exporting ATPase